MSGSNLMELCGVFGGEKKAPIPDDILAFLPNDMEEQEEEENLLQLSDCTFCFANDHIDQIQASNMATLSLKIETHAKITYAETLRRITHNIHQPRGPPTQFS